MSYYGARVTGNQADTEGVEEEEDIFVEMRHAIQVRYEPLSEINTLHCLARKET